MCTVKIVPDSSTLATTAGDLFIIILIVPAQLVQPENGELLRLIDKSATGSIHTEMNG